MLTNNAKKQILLDFFRSSEFTFLDREKALYLLLGHKFRNFFVTLDKLSLKKLEKLYFILTFKSCEALYALHI